MNRRDHLRNWIEKDSHEFNGFDFDSKKKVISELCTDDFKVTNLKDNSMIGQGIDYAMSAVENEKDLIFTVLSMIAAGEFEVVNYQVINAKGDKGGGTIIYRFRENKVSEMIVLDHD